MKQICLFVLVLSMAVSGALGKTGPEPCGIEGTWHGTNGLGGTFVITFMRTGAQTYSAAGEGPVLPPDPITTPGVIAFDFGAHGDLTRTGPGLFDSTWMAIWRVDPNIWGGDLVAAVTYGQVELTGCNTWEVSFTTDLLAYNFGQDPFEEGVLVFQTDPYGASYKRLPKYP